MMKFSTYRRMIVFTAAVLSMAVLPACALVDPDTSILSPSMWRTVERNKKNLKKLQVGMTKSEVKNRMGEPVSDEVYVSDNCWWYYTRTCWSDGRATRDECTPLVFDANGKLAGWGIEFYRARYNYHNWSEKAVLRVLE